jgi:hypothetical protein
VAVSCGASSTTPTIPTPCRSPAGRLRRSGRPAPIARRCLPFCLAPPARRGYGYRMSMPVVDGTGVGRARPGQGSCAPLRAIGPASRTGSRYGPALPSARRGYRRRVSTSVVDGTGVGRARPGQGSCAPLRAIGPASRTGSRYGPALPTALPSPERYGKPGDGTALPCPPCARIVCRKTAAGGSAYCAAPSRPPESGAFRCSEKSCAAFRRLRAKRGLDGAYAQYATISCGFPAQCAAKT